MVIKFNPDNLKERLSADRIGREIILFDSTASTNDTAAEYAKNKDNDGLIIFAENQTAGRGRSGSRWVCSKGKSLLFSVVLCGIRFPAEMLALCSAVAAAKAVGTVQTKQARIKWPNDILIDNKKVAGILVESRRYDYGEGYIIGIGVNCNQTVQDFPEELRQTATSLKIESKRHIDRLSFARRLLSSLDEWTAQTERNCEEIVEEWKKLSLFLGHRVSVVYNGKNFSGNCIGIDPQKGLILQLENGGVRMFDAAHTTIAK
jgi:BirA family biotin operon repressor/biotin-[acetyl-CoA-carboxylase] ligase